MSAFLADEAAFRALSRLRVRLDEDRTPIARPSSRNRRLAKDHLYFHGPWVLGIYYERETERQARAARRYWIARCERVVGGPEGDFDGIVLFRPRTRGDVPRCFFGGNHKGNPSNFRSTPGQVGVSAGKTPSAEALRGKQR